MSPKAVDGGSVCYFAVVRQAPTVTRSGVDTNMGGSPACVVGSWSWAWGYRPLRFRGRDLLEAEGVLKIDKRFAKGFTVLVWRRFPLSLASDVFSYISLFCFDIVVLLLWELSMLPNPSKTWSFTLHGMCSMEVLTNFFLLFVSDLLWGGFEIIAGSNNCWLEFTWATKAWVVCIIVGSNDSLKNQSFSNRG